MTWRAHNLVLWCALNQIVWAQAGSTRKPLPQLAARQPGCEQVEVRPNLVLGEATTISGHIVDNKGVPLRDSTVELRWLVSPTRESPRQSVQTDGKGDFRFERAEAGPYRLLASPTHTYAQPEFLNCAGKRCKLQIQLQPSRAETPELACPVR